MDYRVVFTGDTPDHKMTVKVLEQAPGVSVVFFRDNMDPLNSGWTDCLSNASALSMAHEYIARKGEIA